MNENEAIELAERNIKSAEASLRKACEQLDEAKKAARKCGHAEKMRSLIAKHGFPSFSSVESMAPRMDGENLLVFLPGGNREWACATFLAVAEFCLNSPHYPRFDRSGKGVIRIIIGK